MTIGGSLLLIAVGAILRYAVTARVAGVDLRSVGLILIVVGVVGLVISLAWLASARRRRPTLAATTTYSDHPAAPPPSGRYERVERRTYPEDPPL